MDKNTLRLTNIASIVVIIAFGLVPIFKFLNNQQKNSVVVKTDLNEKYILRDTSLTSFNFTKDDLLKSFEEDKLPLEKELISLKKQLTKELARLKNAPDRPAWMQEKIKECKNYKTKKERDYCNNVLTPNLSNLKSELSEKIEIKELELKLINFKIDEITKEEESIFLKGIRFRPIFQDLNGSFIDKSYEKVACVNPKLDKSILKLIDEKKGQFSEGYNKKFDAFPLSDGYVIPKYDGSAIDYLKIKACKKYAKFKN
tara:strand:+ start:69 stop:839 length:771 start_codon:yes stop_codon:yes gene_type:complete